MISTEVGYSGGITRNPTYEQVCSHTTGHAEVVKVEFNPSEVSYAKLLDLFFDIHDPTSLNRQGLDFGDNYRSAIYFTTPEQEASARQAIAQLENDGKYHRPIVTQIELAGPFYARKTIISSTRRSTAAASAISLRAADIAAKPAGHLAVLGAPFGKQAASKIPREQGPAADGGRRRLCQTRHESCGRLKS